MGPCSVLVESNPSPKRNFLKRKRKVVQGLLHDPLPQHDLVCFM
jgi:hypothetical protein